MRGRTFFSFGAVLYEMLTGRRAFPGETKVSTLAAILNRDPQPLSDTTPRELDQIVQRCLRKDPASRIQTTADLKAALEELKEESDSGRLNVPAGPASRKPRGTIRFAVVALWAVLSAGAWWFWTSRGTPGAVNRDLRQLTFDAGQSTNPALSPGCVSKLRIDNLQ